jgi:hypothetical protein
MSKGKRFLLFIIIFVNILGWGIFLIQWYMVTTQINMEILATKTIPEDLNGINVIIKPITFDPISRNFEFDTNLIFPYDSNIKMSRFGLLDFYFAGRKYHTASTVISPECVGLPWSMACTGGRGAPTHPSFIFDSAGWYPFERYFGTITVNSEFDTGSVPLPVKLELSDNTYTNVTQLVVSTKQNGNTISIYFTQPFEKRFLFVMVIFLFIFFQLRFLILQIYQI